MKLQRIFALVLALAVVIMAQCMQVFAEGEGVQVYVTIAKGEVALAQEAVTVTDADSDGVLSISDALYAAHEARYDGGAAAGYGCAMTDYGLSMTKLWGVDNGGSYGYYVNNASPMSLADPVSEGDYITAYAFTDLTAWSDTYSYFDVNTAEVEAGQTVTLTLSAAGYDESWNPVNLPVEGASIIVNGADTGVVTDTEGKATVTITAEGRSVISAASSTQTLVPPVCIVTVPETQISAGVPGYVWVIGGTVAVAAIAIILAVNKERK